MLNCNAHAWHFYFAIIYLQSLPLEYQDFLSQGSCWTVNICADATELGSWDRRKLASLCWSWGCLMLSPASLPGLGPWPWPHCFCCSSHHHICQSGPKAQPLPPLQVSVTLQTASVAYVYARQQGLNLSVCLLLPGISSLLMHVFHCPLDFTYKTQVQRQRY